MISISPLLDDALPDFSDLLLLFAGTGGLNRIPNLAYWLDFTTNQDRKNGGAAESALSVTRASTGYAKTKAGLLVPFGNNVARRTDSGLLLEPTRTNVLVYSQDTTTGSWSKANITTSGDVTTAPDGTLTADKVEETNATGLHQLLQGGLSITNGQLYTTTFFAKAAERQFVTFNSNLAGFGTNDNATFDLVNGTVTYVGAGTTASIEAFANGWYRCRVTNTATATGTYAIFISPSDTDTTARAKSYAGTTGYGFYVWGVQYENAAYPTSYIPTTTSSVVRADDLITVNGAAGFLNAAQGTLFVEAQVLGGTNVEHFFATIDDGTNANAIRMSNNNVTGNVRVLTWAGGVSQTDFGNSVGTVSDQTAFIKRSASYELNNYRAATAGLSVGTDTSALVPTNLNRIILGQGGFGPLRPMRISQVAYYSRNLTNAEHLAITR